MRIGYGRVLPYITHVIRRIGNWILNLTPPVAAPTTRLDLESRVLGLGEEPRRN